MLLDQICVSLWRWEERRTSYFSMFVCVCVCVGVFCCPNRRGVWENAVSTRRRRSRLRIGGRPAHGVFLFCVQDLNKRLSLPADIRIPDGYLEKLQLSSPPFDQPLSRRSRRASLVSPPRLPSTRLFLFLLFLLLRGSTQSLITETPPVLVSMATGPGSTMDGFIWSQKHSPPTLCPSDCCRRSLTRSCQLWHHEAFIYEEENQNKSLPPTFITWIDSSENRNSWL